MRGHRPQLLRQNSDGLLAAQGRRVKLGTCGFPPEFASTSPAVVPLCADLPLYSGACQCDARRMKPALGPNILITVAPL
jgi:hypothetical protein